MKNFIRLKHLTKRKVICVNLINVDYFEPIYEIKHKKTESGNDSVNAPIEIGCNIYFSSTEPLPVFETLEDIIYLINQCEIESKKKWVDGLIQNIEQFIK